MSVGIVLAVACALFAYFLSGARSTAYLLYYLGFVAFISPDISDGGLVSVEGLDGANVLFKMSFRVAVTAGFLALLLRRREGIGQIFRPHSLPIVLFFAWALLSVQRAQAPMVSLLRLGELFAFFVAGVVLLVESARFHGPRTVVRWHCLALLQLPLITLLFLFVEPEIAYHEGVNGIGRLGNRFINANSLGFACAVVILWSTVELKERREHARNLFFEKVVPFLVLALTTYVLLRARSRTAMITTILGQVIIWFPYPARQAWRLPAFGACALAALVFSSLHADAVFDWFLRGDSAHSLASGTGRTGLWAALLAEQFPKAPLLGAGYLALSDAGTFRFGGVDWSNAHNTYLFALISTGIVGFVCIVVSAFAPAWAAFRRVFRATSSEQPFWVLLFALQTVIIVASITGFGICGYPNPAMCFHFALYSYLVTRTRVRRTAAIRRAHLAPRLLEPRPKPATATGAAR